MKYFATSLKKSSPSPFMSFKGVIVFLFVGTASQEITQVFLTNPPVSNFRCLEFAPVNVTEDRAFADP